MDIMNEINDKGLGDLAKWVFRQKLKIKKDTHYVLYIELEHESELEDGTEVISFHNIVLSELNPEVKVFPGNAIHRCME